MHLSSEGKIGIFLALVGLGGAGATMIAPEHTEIGWGLIALAVIGLIALGVHHFGNRIRFVPIVVMSATIFAICIAWYFWPRQASKTEVLSPAVASSNDVLHNVEIERRRDAILSRLHNKYPQRIIVEVTPNYLMDLYNDKMPIDGDRLIAPFIGKWLLLSGPIFSVTTISTNFIQIVFAPQGTRLTYMLFDGQTDRLSVLRRNQIIWAFCQFKKATGQSIDFEHCDFIELEGR